MMQSPRHQVEIVCGILQRACICVLLCIDAPGRGSIVVLYICLSCLE